MASSARKQQQHLLNMYGTTAAPPPIPRPLTRRQLIPPTSSLASSITSLPPSPCPPQHQASNCHTFTNRRLLEACVLYADSQSTELEFTSLRVLSCSLEKVGSEAIGWLFDTIGFKNPVEKGQTQVRSLAWVSKDSVTGAGHGYMTGISDSSRYHPFVVGLRFQVRSQKYTLITDSGPVVIVPQVDFILVTIGDIAQVGSNGGLKKVRGRPIPCSDAEEGYSNSSADDITVTLLMTLPTESTVSPLTRKTVSTGDCESEDDCEEFDWFSFEDYAWRVYHDGHISPKDPLDRYRRRG